MSNKKVQEYILLKKRLEDIDKQLKELKPEIVEYVRNHPEKELNKQGKNPFIREDIVISRKKVSFKVVVIDSEKRNLVEIEEAKNILGEKWDSVKREALDWKSYDKEVLAGNINSKEVKKLNNLIDIQEVTALKISN